VNSVAATLLRIALASLSVAVGHCADAPLAMPGIATVSSCDQLLLPHTATHAAMTGSGRRTLDLRPSDLPSPHVQNMQQPVTAAEPDQAETIAISAAPWLPEGPDAQPTVTGIASLYWAARHPTQAWRVFLPIPLDGHDANIDNHDRAAERATPATLTETRDISAKPAPTTLAHDSGGNGVRRSSSGATT
jgi:hypothetical protein